MGISRRGGGGEDGHVMLRGAERFHYGSFVGMPVSRYSGGSCVTMAEVYADSRIVIPTLLPTKKIRSERRGCNA